jgi:hypothetical protein
MIFGLRSDQMSHGDWQSHLEDLQGEFQRILEILEFMDVPEEIRFRIGSGYNLTLTTSILIG